jgi:hypothetical protein
MIELRFKDSGAAYEAAKEIADRLGISVRDNLLTCISEGHRVLSIRTVVQPSYLDISAFELRLSIATDPKEIRDALRLLHIPLSTDKIKSLAVEFWASKKAACIAH